MKVTTRTLFCTCQKYFRFLNNYRVSYLNSPHNLTLSKFKIGPKYLTKERKFLYNFEILVLEQYHVDGKSMGGKKCSKTSKSEVISLENREEIFDVRSWNFLGILSRWLRRNGRNFIVKKSLQGWSPPVFSTYDSCQIAKFTSNLYNSILESSIIRQSFIDIFTLSLIN